MNYHWIIVINLIKSPFLENYAPWKPKKLLVLYPEAWRLIARKALTKSIWNLISCPPEIEQIPRHFLVLTRISVGHKFRKPGWLPTRGINLCCLLGKPTTTLMFTCSSHFCRGKKKQRRRKAGYVVEFIPKSLPYSPLSPSPLGFQLWCCGVSWVRTPCLSREQILMLGWRCWREDQNRNPWFFLTEDRGFLWVFH